MSKIQCNDYTYKFHNSNSRLWVKKRANEYIKEGE